MEQLRFQKCEQIVTLAATFFFPTWRRCAKQRRLLHSLAFVFRSSQTQALITLTEGSLKESTKEKQGKAHENAESVVLAVETNLRPKHVALRSANH